MIQFSKQIKMRGEVRASPPYASNYGLSGGNSRE